MLLLTVVVLSAQVSSGLCGVATAWEDFWSASCEFSTVVSRSRRSVPEEPNHNDPHGLFQYFYPLGDTKEEDLLKTSGRASDVHPHSLSNWLDDLVDLWQSECHHRHKRSLGDEEGRSSGWSMFRRNVTNSEDAENSGEEGESSAISSSSSDGKEKIGGSGVGGAAAKDDTAFFASYGGDVEYFFPLVSMGIPFDGEISLLGFHGFKGLFPYK